ncbi:MAG: ATP synthase F0 subunit B [Desulfobacterales bacterium]
MINLNESVLIQIVNFLVLIWLLNMVLYKPIRRILAERREKISGLEQNIDKAMGDVETKEKTYSEGIREARLNGVKEKEALIQEATSEEKQIIQQINEKAAANLAEVRERVAKEAETARGILLKQVDGFASEIGQKILGRAV